MSAITRIATFQLRDIIRNRWVVAYGVFFLAITELLLRFAGPRPAILTLADLSLLIVPLATAVFAVTYVHQGRDFMRLLLAQPVRRRQLFAGVYAGLAIPLMAAYVIGAGLPLLLRWADADIRSAVPMVLATGAALSLAYSGIAILVAMRVEDHVRAFAIVIAVWLATAILYDGVALIVVALTPSMAVEKALLALFALNPIDTARLLMLVRFDAAALLGATAATMHAVFGSGRGVALASAGLVIWIVVPAVLALRSMERADF